MADDEFLSDDDYVPVPLKEVARHELHPAGTEARIADLEASVLFWKKDAIAGTTRIRELEAERDSLQEDVIEVTTRMVTAEAIIHAIDFRLGRDGWTLELAQALGYSQSDRGDKQ